MPTVLKELIGVEVKSERYMALHIISKFFIPFSISLMLFLIKDLISASLLVIISLCVCKLSGISLSSLKKYLMVIMCMTSFIVISFTFFTTLPGHTLFEINVLRFQAEKSMFEWKIMITDTDLQHIVFFILRIFTMVLSALLLLGSITDRDIVWGLRSAGVPYGISVAVSLFFRGIQLFISDFHTIREAMIARGIDFKRTSLIKKFFLYVNALIPLLSLSVTRSFEVSMALESRGIAPTTRVKTTYHIYKIKRDDYTVIALFSVLVALFAWWYLWHL
ncbi:MAG: hypothetical protein DRJ41_03005 [Thermoprotei archaeon]|nr:MAG: hypothetical protein DRJ41_03005 [Thermoprotei archaeon]